MAKRKTVDELSQALTRRLYHEEPTAWRVHWHGIESLKLPADLIAYQELMTLGRPDLIIETGTKFGGSALFFADMMNMLDINGEVVTVDVKPKLDQHANTMLSQHVIDVTSLRGKSTDEGVLDQVARKVAEHGRVMVVLDSDHSTANVRAELQAYAPFVSVNQFLVVEDTSISFLGIKNYDKHGGPKEAVDEFLKARKATWTRIRGFERFKVSYNIGGWLRRLR